MATDAAPAPAPGAEGDVNAGGIVSSDEVVGVDSSDEDVVAVGPGTSTSAAASPIEFWVQRVGEPMVRAVNEVAACGNRIQWNLPPHTLGLSIVDRTVAHIKDTLAEGYVAAFYVGYTTSASWRWRHPETGHRRMGVPQHGHLWGRGHQG